MNRLYLWINFIQISANSSNLSHNLVWPGFVFKTAREGVTRHPTLNRCTDWLTWWSLNQLHNLPSSRSLNWDPIKMSVLRQSFEKLTKNTQNCGTLSQYSWHGTFSNRVTCHVSVRTITSYSIKLPIHDVNQNALIKMYSVHCTLHCGCSNTGTLTEVGCFTCTCTYPYINQHTRGGWETSQIGPDCGLGAGRLSNMLIK